jgi:DNA-binding LacI/PurR family transcriptional regulator
MATIKEVAERAQVSIATVSYVLNGTGSVSPGKRRAVLEAAAALNYRPSYRGRALQAQRSTTLGLVLPAIAKRVAEPSFGELLAGLTDGAADRGYHILLAPSTAEQSEAGMYSQLFRSGRVDGVIILDTTIDDPRIAAARSEQMPYICAGRAEDDSAYVAIDGQAGMLEAMAHLIVRGHERIGLLQPPLEQTLAVDQDAGYREALAESGLPFDPLLIVEGGQSEAEGYAAAEELLALPEPPTALVAGTSALAFGALHAIHDQRRSVGKDIALISFEDTAAAAHTAPPLTAVRQPLYAQLIVRRSCGE